MTKVFMKDEVGRYSQELSRDPFLKRKLRSVNHHVAGNTCSCLLPGALEQLKKKEVNCEA